MYKKYSSWAASGPELQHKIAANPMEIIQPNIFINYHIIRQINIHTVFIIFHSILLLYICTVVQYSIVHNIDSPPILTPLVSAVVHADYR